MAITLTTDRLLLRDLKEGDWEPFHRCFSDPETMRFMLASGPFTQEQSRHYVQQAMASAQEQPRLQYMLAVVLQAGGQLIGQYRLTVVDVRNREANIGFGLDRRYWGQGLATEGVRALLNFGFGQLGLHRIFAEVVAANVASARVLEKAGMRREGHFREKAWVEDNWHDCYYYALLDHEGGNKQSRRTVRSPATKSKTTA